MSPASTPAFAAGERCLMTSYRCENACPLAEQANVRVRRYGGRNVGYAEAAE